jgi:hypothetical protein
MSTAGHVQREHPEIEMFDPDFGDPGHAAHMASIVLPLALDRQRWIRRRTDRIRLGSENVIQWDVQLEFSIPDLCAWIGEEVWLTRVPFPISLHSKTIATRLRITDESGTEYSMLTTVEYQQVVCQMLETLAASVLAIPSIDATLAQLLRDVVESPDDSHAARECLQGTTGGKTLLDNETFSAMVHEVEDQFMIMVLLDYAIGVPWIVHLTYEEHLRVETPNRRLPWNQRPPLQTPRLAIGMADSYHAEFDTPPGLQFDPTHTTVEWHLYAPQPRQQRQRILTTLIALHAAGAARAAYARISASWVPQPGGTRRIAWYISLGTFLLFLLALLLRLFPGFEPNGNSGAAASVLLAIPALYALVVIQPGLHPVTGQYTRGPRAALATAGLLALLGAAALAIQFPGPPAPMAAAGIGWRTVAWGALAIAAGALTWIAYRWR